MIITHYFRYFRLYTTMLKSTTRYISSSSLLCYMPPLLWMTRKASTYHSHQRCRSEQKSLL